MLDWLDMKMEGNATGKLHKAHSEDEEEYEDG
jgi:hypothetical protein